MTGRRLSAVPEGGSPQPDEEVAERPRFLAAVTACSGCGAAVRVLDTASDGRVCLDAEPVPLTSALLEAGAAYVMVRRAGTVVTVSAGLLAGGALDGTETCLVRHHCG